MGAMTHPSIRHTVAPAACADAMMCRRMLWRAAESI